MTSIRDIEIDLRDRDDNISTLYIEVLPSKLSAKWYHALAYLVEHQYHLEKNYCWFGFTETDRNPKYLCDQINNSIACINAANIGYTIRDWFSPENTVAPDDGIDHDHMNRLHRYFEDLQGTSGCISEYYKRADSDIKWHIRQLNLLCHEHESLILSLRKQSTAPDWQRPSQLMCWLNAPRFNLDQDDHELFGIDTINRDFGGVYLGVNKAIGKHHWEVFNDEGRDSRLSELTTSTLKSQTEAAGDFDIEWGQSPAGQPWQDSKLAEFRSWLVINGFDPNDKALTIGHPKVAQVNLERSFGTKEHRHIWNQLNKCLDVFAVRCGGFEAVYTYRWSDPDFAAKQIAIIQEQNS